MIAAHDSVPLACPELEGVQHRFAEVGGVRMHYAEAGTGEPIVLLHGWPQHWWSYRKVIRPLARNYRVICPDLRGIGWSEGSAAAYDFLGLAANLLGLLDALRLSRVHLVGHDWGAAVGYTTCFQWPERVGRYVALGAVTPWSSEAPWSAPGATWRLCMRAWHVFVLAALGRFAIRSLGLPEHALRVWRHRGQFEPHELEIYLRPLRSAAAESATVRWYRNLVSREIPYFVKHSRSLRLRTQTLHLNGERDPLTLGIPDGYRHGNAEHMRLELIRDCGHFIAEEQPELLVARIREFLA